MSIWDSLKATLRQEPKAMPEAKPEAEQPPSRDVQASTFDDLLASINVSSSVTARTALQSSAVYACVNLIGGAIASMPAHIYRRTPEGRERADHDYWWFLNERPHESLSASTMWEFLLAALLLQGDAFAQILRRSNYSKDIVGLLPWAPSRVEVKAVGGRLKYILTPEEGSPITLDQDDMLHIPGPGFDGTRGMSQIKYVLRNAVGIALAADNYSREFFDNSARPDFALSAPGNLTEAQVDLLRKTWQDRYAGAGNRHRPAVLFGGMSVETISLNSEDAQLLTTRQFQVEDIARIFGVPPFMIGHTEKTTSWGSGVEQMAIGFVKFTLMRHLKKIEQELNNKFWPSRERFFIEFSTAGLERGDYKTRNEGYRIALGRAGEPAWMSVNEVRRMENLPPIPGGDTVLSSTPDQNSKGTQDE